MGVIDFLKKKLKEIQGSLTDTSGFIQQGRLTLEPIREAIVNWASQPQNYQKAQALQSWEPLFHPIETAKQSLAQQKITTPQQFATKVFQNAPQEFGQYVQNVSTKAGFPSIVPTVVGGVGSNLLKGPSTFFQKKPIAEHVGDILSTAGALTMPQEMATMGALNPLFKTGETLLTQRRLPTGQELTKSVGEGISFGALFGPLSKIAEPIVNPITKKISPKEFGNINTWVRVIRKAPPEAKLPLVKMATSLFGRETLAKAIRGGVGLGAYEALQPAENLKERMKNVLSGALQGAAFGTGEQVLGTGLSYAYPRVKGMINMFGESTKDLPMGLSIKPIQRKKTKAPTTPLSQETKIGESGGVVNNTGVYGSRKPQTKFDDFINDLEKEKANFKAKDIPPKNDFKDTLPKNPSELEAQSLQSQAKADLFINDLKQKIIDWMNKRNASELIGIKKASQIQIPEGVNFDDLIKKIENPDMKVDKNTQEVASKIRKLFDELYNDAKKSGIDMNYVKNYITHIWQEPIEEVIQKYKSLGQKFKFSQERILPTYEEGIKMGLTPKYSDPRQIIAEYVKNLEKAKANIELFKTLKEGGFISEKRIPGFEPLTAAGFPSKQVRIGENKIYEGVYYAPKEVADLVNKVFSGNEPNVVLGTLSKVSSSLQDLVMSGGIPKTPINAWTLAQLQKEFTSGRIISPLKSFFISFSEDATKKYFANNINDAIEAQKRGIDLRIPLNIENLKDKGFIEGVFGKNISEAWNKFINEPTFKRFMPTLQLQFFIDTKNSLLKKGIPLNEAYDIAAKATKNFYGITSSAERLFRDQNLESLKTILFFAPRYRESMFSFWLNNLKALKNPLAPENANNVRFLLGGLLVFLGMNQINKLNTGHSMLENPKGMEDKMLIKLPDGSYVGVPFMSSIATVPRALFRQAMRIKEMDLSGAAKDALSTYSSVLAKPIFDVFSNSDYFGKPIYDEGDSEGVRREKVAKYLFSQYLAHPYLKEIFDPRNQKDPAYQRLSRAMELPFRFYTQKTINTKYFFQFRDEALKMLNNQERKALDAIPKIDNSTDPNDPNRRILKYQIYLTYPKTFQAKQLIELAMAQKTGKEVDPLYLVDYNTASKYMRYETLPEGSPERKAMVKLYPELNVLFQARSEYFQKNPLANEDGQKAFFSMPQPSENVKKLMEQKQWNNPEVQAYMDALRTWQNNQRLKLGLGSIDKYGNLEGTSSFGFSYFNKPKLKLKAVRKIKIPKKNVPKVKISTVGKVSIPQLKQPQIKKVKIRLRKTKTRLTKIK
jgi:hypothetical protein